MKADSQFAGRAVSAWRGLKFQIIVGAPEDKFTGLERHMDSFVLIQKDETTGYAFIDHITDQQPDRPNHDDDSTTPQDGVAARSTSDHRAALSFPVSTAGQAGGAAADEESEAS